MSSGMTAESAADQQVWKALFPCDAPLDTGASQRWAGPGNDNSNSSNKNDDNDDDKSKKTDTDTNAAANTAASTAANTDATDNAAQLAADQEEEDELAEMERIAFQDTDNAGDANSDESDDDDGHEDAEKLRLPAPMEVDEREEMVVDRDLIYRVEAAGMTPSDRMTVSFLLQQLLRHGVPALWAQDVACEVVYSADFEEDDFRTPLPSPAPEPEPAPTASPKPAPVPDAIGNAADAISLPTTTMPSSNNTSTSETTIGSISTITGAGTSISTKIPLPPTRSASSFVSGSRDPVAPSSGKKSSQAWTPAEDELGKKALWTIAETDHTEARFAKVAAELGKAGFERSAASVRNRANRIWRHQDGMDDRRPRHDGKPRSTITSARGKKKLQMEQQQQQQHTAAVANTPAAATVAVTATTSTTITAAPSDGQKPAHGPTRKRSREETGGSATEGGEEPASRKRPRQQKKHRQFDPIGARQTEHELSNMFSRRTFGWER